MIIPNSTPLTILLADDDIDDRFIFDKVLKEIPLLTKFITVNDGEELMSYLHKNSKNLPNILFLDLSMPRKTGFECLCEIKEDKELKDIAVIMFSTSFPSSLNYEEGLVQTLKGMGAHDYIRKPGDFALLKEAIHTILIKEIKKLSMKKKKTL